MRRIFYMLVALVPIAVLGIVASLGLTHVRAANGPCTATGYMRDGKNLTAALIVSSSSPNVTNATINATTCDIGIYYGAGLIGTVSKVDVYGSDYFGVVNNGSKVTVTKSKIHDIGDVPFDGLQKGVGVYFVYDSHATGSITHNLIWNYQKGGVVVDGPSDGAKIAYNTVLGLGPVNFIAQNGIELGAGAKGPIFLNYVTDNSYMGNTGYSSGGILLFGGSCPPASALQIGTHVTANTLEGNDVGVYLSNLDVDSNGNCVPTITPTKIYFANNTLSNDAINNTGGTNLENQCCGYQAGISDQGDADQLVNNQICGVGYTPATTPPPYLYMIDDTYTNSPVESGNSMCSNIARGTHIGVKVLAHFAKHPIASVIL